jgi:hypothetical protein
MQPQAYRMGEKTQLMEACLLFQAEKFFAVYPLAGLNARDDFLHAHQKVARTV